MKTMWIDKASAFLGDVGFLWEVSRLDGRVDYRLSERPPHTTSTHEAVLYGWCGRYKDVSTHGRGLWEVIEILHNGRAQIRELEGDKLAAGLRSLGYPELIPGRDQD